MTKYSREVENTRHSKRMSRIQLMEDAGIYSKECADDRRAEEDRRHKKTLENFDLLGEP